METKLQNCFCRQTSSYCSWIFRNVLPKDEHFVIIYSCPVSFLPSYFLSSTKQKKDILAIFLKLFYIQYRKNGWWFMRTIPKRPGKYHKNVSYVIVSYSLFFQSVNAINLRFKGQHNWLSKLNRFYFIYWSLVSGPITIHIQTTNQKYEK